MIIQNSNLSRVEQVPRQAGDAASGITVHKPEHAVESPKAAQPSPDQLQHAVNSINQAMRQSNRGLEFSVDADTQKLVVKVVDTETGDVIRQIPSEETLAISRSIEQFQQGMLLKNKA